MEPGALALLREAVGRRSAICGVVFTAFTYGQSLTRSSNCGSPSGGDRGFARDASPIRQPLSGRHIRQSPHPGLAPRDRYVSAASLPTVQSRPRHPNLRYVSGASVSPGQDSERSQPRAAGSEGHKIAAGGDREVVTRVRRGVHSVHVLTGVLTAVLTVKLTVKAAGSQVRQLRTLLPSMEAKCDARPPAYLLSFRCYGTWLHGDKRASVDRLHNGYRTPRLPPNRKRVAASRERMRYPPYSLDAPRRWAVLEGIRLACRTSDWCLHVAHVRREHAHVVCSADEDPNRVLTELKSQASKRLNERGLDRGRRKRWSRGGSKLYLWTEKQFWAAVSYVLYEQGRGMAVYVASDLRIDIGSEPNPFEPEPKT